MTDGVKLSTSAKVTRIFQRLRSG